MNKKGWMVTGLTLGLIVGSCVSAFAAENIQEIKAYINDTFNFQVNGEAAELTDEYHVIVYNDRSYLPVRAVGNLIGAEIEWNEESKTILINTPQEDEKNTEEAAGDKSEKYSYKKLPQTYENEIFRITAASFSTNVGTDKLSKVYFRITDLGDNTLCVLPAKIKIIADGKEYSNYTSDVELYNQDNRLYSKVLTQKDEELSSYITLPDNAKNAKYIHIEIPVEQSDFDGNKVEYITFDIDTEGK